MSGVASLHATAILALLRANPNFQRPGGTDVVFDGKVPDPTPALPYVVVHFATEMPPGVDGNSLESLSVAAVTRAYVHCVGANAAAARIVAGNAAASLLDVTPTITGRTCSQVYFDATAPDDPNESTGSLTVEQTDVYRFSSWPA